MQLHARCAVDQADVLERTGAQRAGRQLIPAQVDILCAGAEFVLEANLVTISVPTFPDATWNTRNGLLMRVYRSSSV
jgi:hypothetical protein